MTDINKLVLTKKQIKEAIDERSDKEGLSRTTIYFFGSEAVSLATVKKVVGWENEPCADHWKKIIPRRDCLLCQQEIKKLLGEG